MLLGTIKGCNFANGGADRNSIVYVRAQELGDLTSYVSERSVPICQSSELDDDVSLGCE